MSSTAAILGLLLPWKIVVGCKRKLQKPSALAPTSGLLFAFPGCAKQHDCKSSHWAFQASAHTWVWALKLATVMVSPAVYGGDQLLMANGTFPRSLCRDYEASV